MMHLPKLALLMRKRVVHASSSQREQPPSTIAPGSSGDISRSDVHWAIKGSTFRSTVYKEYLRKGRGRRGVPLIDVGGEILRGYSPKSLDAALERHG